MRNPDHALSANLDDTNIGRLTRPVAFSCRVAFAALLALAGAGCATAIPLPSFMGSASDVTGSISPGARLSPGLDVEDWRRAKGALSLALDPQGNGSPVAWDNPRSGVKGSFAPVGAAAAVEERICRAFQAHVGGSVSARSLEGRACRDKSGEWALDEVKPRKAS
jgi:surface antigen